LTGPEGPLPLETSEGVPLDPPVMWKIHLSFYNRSLTLVFFVPSSNVAQLSLCKAVVQNHTVWAGVSPRDVFDTVRRSRIASALSGRYLRLTIGQLTMNPLAVNEPPSGAVSSPC